MIVRDLGDAWQIVFQTDHADLSGQLASSWADPLPEGVVTAARRHDDGWAVWERAPRVEGGVPVDFTAVAVETHIALYRAGITTVAAEDPLAGLLVAMHGAGLYRQRYGLDPSLRSSFHGAEAGLVEGFVAEQESSFGGLAALAGVSDSEARRYYELLQLFDRLSLAFCMRDLAGSAPIDLQDWRLEPSGPFSLRISPFPFAPAAGSLTLRRSVVGKDFHDEGDFRRLLEAARVETVEILDRAVSGLPGKIALACRILAREGLVDGVLGHVSVRAAPERMLLRCRGPKERGLEFTTADDIRELSLDGELVGGPPGYSAPKEHPIHGELYRARDEVGCVVHAHPPRALLAGLAGLELKPVFGAYNIPAARMALEGVPVYARSALIARPELGRELVAAMDGKDVCLMRGHGIVATGATVEEAVVRAVNLNVLMTVHVELRRLGAQPAEISADDRAELPDLGSALNDLAVWRYLAARAGPAPP